MARQILGTPLRNIIILALGLLWGIALFLLGFRGAFTIGGPDFVWGTLAVVFGYLMVLPIAIMAYMRPEVEMDISAWVRPPNAP